jgi:glucose-6-phosphate 1-dehydrogenase
VDAERSRLSNAAEPCTVILFGASGDLAKRKVVPAMYDLANHQALGPQYAIVGFARTPMTDESFRSALGDAAKTMSEVGPIDPKKWNDFAGNLQYHAGEYGNADDFSKLAKHLEELESSKKLCGNRLFYLSTPPEVYPRPLWTLQALHAEFLDPHHHRKALWPRSRFRQRAEQDRPRRFR